MAATAEQVYETLQPVRREVATGDQTHLMHVVPYRTPDDRIDGVVLTFVDITDRAELRVERDDESVWCETNPGAIQRILRNLTGNATKYTLPGGRVELRCAAGRTGAMVEVEDSGIGMSPAFQGRAFEPFSQESEGRSREFKGVGLGLAIVQKLTELIGGRLEVESTPERGTRFALFLPRHDPAA